MLLNLYQSQLLIHLSHFKKTYSADKKLLGSTLVAILKIPNTDQEKVLHKGQDKHQIQNPTDHQANLFSVLHNSDFGLCMCPARNVFYGSHGNLVPRSVCRGLAPYKFGFSPSSQMRNMSRAMGVGQEVKIIQGILCQFYPQDLKPEATLIPSSNPQYRGKCFDAEG